MLTKQLTGGRAIRGVALACALSLGLLACGGSDDNAAPGTPEDVEAALAEGGKITVWAWEPTLEQVAADFEDEHPGVEVDLVNAGTGNEQYTALQNAMGADSGVPDVAQIEYFALGQFTIADRLLDLSGLGASELSGTFTSGPWDAVRAGGGIHGLPMDSGPMALFYNQDVFEEHGVEVPTTWEEYVEAARALRAADPGTYITSDTGESGLTTSLIWQAGGQPYTVDGTEVGIDFTDGGTRTYAELWQQLIDEELLAPINGWTDEWYQGLGDGTIATLVTGAWMPANFVSGVPNASGSWRVAPMPQWEEGGQDTAENGGSSLTVPSQGRNHELAYAFVEYANTGPGAATRVANGAFPATNSELRSEEFLNTEIEYFGGQQANLVFAESAANVVPDWSYLPFQAYANSIFNDTVGQSYVSDTPLTESLAAWQEASRNYAEDQGFTLTD
nr:sugar ABC transporter substrate-binding protein [Streptomyces sp. NBRC 109706]